MSIREKELVKTTAFFGAVATVTSVIASTLMIDKIVQIRDRRKTKR